MKVILSAAHRLSYTVQVSKTTLQCFDTHNLKKVLFNQNSSKIHFWGKWLNVN